MKGPVSRLVNSEIPYVDRVSIGFEISGTHLLGRSLEFDQGARVVGGCVPAGPGCDGGGLIVG